MSRFGQSYPSRALVLLPSDAQSQSSSRHLQALSWLKLATTRGRAPAYGAQRSKSLFFALVRSFPFRSSGFSLPSRWELGACLLACSRIKALKPRAWRFKAECHARLTGASRAALGSLWWEYRSAVYAAGLIRHTFAATWSPSARAVSDELADQVRLLCLESSFGPLRCKLACFSKSQDKRLGLRFELHHSTL